MVAVPPDTRASGAHDRHETSAGRRNRVVNRVTPRVKTLGAFWTKISNDAIFNLSAMLAYNLLMSAFPILLVILAIAGIILNRASPGQYADLRNTIASAFPGETGHAVVANVTNSLNKSAGLLLVVGIAVAIFTGSGLFLMLEWVLNIVFRLRGRDPLRQRLMSVGMLLLYAVFIPIVLLASLIPPVIVRALPIGSNDPVFGFLIQAAGDVFSVIVAAPLFGAIYIVVPNRRVKLREVWKGTLVATLLLVIYETLFPFYVGRFLRPENFGSTAGFVVMFLIFFYYLAFILIFGAEINSWVSGQRQAAGDIVAILHEAQAKTWRRHGDEAERTSELAETTQEGTAHPWEIAAGHLRSSDEDGNGCQPSTPRFDARAAVSAMDGAPSEAAPGIVTGQPQSAHTLGALGATGRQPREYRDRRALWAVLVAGTVALVPVLRLLLDLLRDDHHHVAR